MTYDRIETELLLICTLYAVNVDEDATREAKNRMGNLTAEELEELRNAAHRLFNTIDGWIGDVESDLHRLAAEEARRNALNTIVIESPRS